MILAIIFAALTGLFKALRDRDEWGAKSQTDHVETWYEAWKWYRAWSDTPKYWLLFPIDFWHNADVLVMAFAYAAGRGEVDWTVFPFLAIALTVKTVFYEFLLLRHPIAGLKMWLNKLRRKG